MEESGERRTRVVVADDHPLYRASVARAVQHHPDLELIGEASDGTAALAAVNRLRPEVAIVDLSMPGMNGTELLRAIKRAELPTRVVLLSGVLEEEDVYSAIELGAAAVLPKTMDAPQLLDAVAAVAQGGTVFAPELQDGIATQIRRRARAELSLLSDREREILTLMSQGLSGPEIGRRIFISPSTVKTHTERLYDKLGVHDRAAAVAEGMRRGLLE